MNSETLGFGPHCSKQRRTQPHCPSRSRKSGTSSCLSWIFCCTMLPYASQNSDVLRCTVLCQTASCCTIRKHIMLYFAIEYHSTIYCFRALCAKLYEAQPYHSAVALRCAYARSTPASTREHQTLCSRVVQAGSHQNKSHCTHQTTITALAHIMIPCLSPLYGVLAQARTSLAISQSRLGERGQRQPGRRWPRDVPKTTYATPSRS